VDLELVEPIFLNEPVEVTITVETEEDILGLTIAAGSIDPTILVEGEHKWVVNAKAHTPLQLSTTIRFTKEGYFNIHGSAYDPRKGSGVRDVERVRITPLGGTVNPPPEREPGTPAPAKRLDTPPPKATPESSPTPSSEGKASPEARQVASNQGMIYGPFDSSDAVMASGHDGIAFRQSARWKKESNSGSIENTGWVTAIGYFYYYDRNDNYVPARHTRVHLWDADPPDGPEGDDYLASATTDANSFWEIGPVPNQDDPDEGTLDLYVIWETYATDSEESYRRVIDYYGGWTYQWQSGVFNDVSDGTVDFGTWYIPDGSDWEGAMWIFQDLRRAWEYVWSHTNTDPGSATVRWQPSGTPPLPPPPWEPASLFWPYWPVYGVQIAPGDEELTDIVIHELAHQYMYNAMGWWFWPSDRFDDMWTCLQHEVFSQETLLCAWTEGWADFFPLAVNDDPCYDFVPIPCTGIPDVDHYNLEVHTWYDGRPYGDTVEGRVAGALYDLFDASSDGWDWAEAVFGFASIWNLVRTIPDEESFADFWDSWRATGYNQYWAVQALYQNTIDYEICWGDETMTFQPANPIPGSTVTINVRSRKPHTWVRLDGPGSPQFQGVDQIGPDFIWTWTVTLWQPGRYDYNFSVECDPPDEDPPCTLCTTNYVVVVTPTPTPTHTPTPTPTFTPTPTCTPTPTPTPTHTPTSTPTPTWTPALPTNTPTNTPVPPTNTPTGTPLPPTNTPTNTPVPPTHTPTPTPTMTPTPLPIVYVDDTLGSDSPMCGASFGEGACKTISYALENRAAPGSTVSVAAGTYTETITLKPEVRVEGAGAEATTINGNGEGSVVTVSGSNITSTVVLSRFTITGGNTYNGGGIYISDGASPTIKNNIIRDNSAGFGGGGIWIHLSSPTISGNIIRNNSAGELGSGIAIANSSPTVVSNTISFNSTRYGGGIYINLSSPAISDNVINNNSASRRGGGIYIVNRSSPTISGNTIKDNSAGTGRGGGIYIYLSSPTVNGNAIRDNSATNGGGIYAYFGSTLTAHGNIICGNSNYQLYNSTSETLDAIGNWWGTNSPGSAEIYGPVNYDPWIAMTISANPTAMTVPGSSIVRVAMQGGGYNVPDGTRIDWSTTLGTITPLWSTTTNGWAQTTLSSSSTGEAIVSGMEACGQVVTTTVTFLPPTPCFPSGLFADFDGDCRVTVVDIMLVASRWRTSCDNPDPDNNPDTPNYEPCYDLDENCDIDIIDIMMVAAHWGETCP
jgi:parallel beta-helix repeat protein